MTIYYTLKQAAAATGKHKSTILRAVQAEKVPNKKDVHGNYQIEADGLHKVYPLVRNAEESLRTDSVPIANAPECNDAPLHNVAEPLRTDAQPLRNDAEPLRNGAEVKALAALNEQQAGQVDDLRSTIDDLQRRLDQAEADRRQLEADRRAADENATRQVDQLSQLLAMKEKAMQTMQLEHQTGAQSKRSWWPFGQASV